MEQYRMIDRPGMTLDIKKKRLRVHKNTLQFIKGTQFFRLLVNPESKGMVIEACSEKDVGAYDLTKMAEHKGSIELYSQDLVKQIMVCAGFTGLEPIKLYGYPIREQCAMFFRLGEGEKVSSGELHNGTGKGNE